MHTQEEKHSRAFISLFSALPILMDEPQTQKHSNNNNEQNDLSLHSSLDTPEQIHFINKKNRDAFLNHFQSSHPEEKADSDIETDIVNAIDSYFGRHIENVSVTSENHIVVLKGVLNTRTDRFNLINSVRNLKGVKRVDTTDLKVRA